MHGQRDCAQSRPKRVSSRHATITHSFKLAVYKALDKIRTWNRKRVKGSQPLGKAIRMKYVSTGKKRIVKMWDYLGVRGASA